MIHRAEFSFLVNEIVFLTDFGDKGKNSKAESMRGLIYETFRDRQDFVDNNIRELITNQQEYLQVLYAQGLVYLWTSLETLVKHLIAGLIKFDEEILEGELLRKIGPKAKLLGLDDDEKSRYLADLIIKNRDCRDRFGADRFDCFLGVLELNGTFDGDHIQRMLALHRLRNCIVHNDSIADARLCQQVEGEKYKIGDKIVLTGDEFRVYEQTVLAYIAEIYYRLNKKLGAPEEFLSILRKLIN